MNETYGKYKYYLDYSTGQAKIKKVTFSDVVEEKEIEFRKHGNESSSSYEDEVFRKIENEIKMVKDKSLKLEKELKILGNYRKMTKFVRNLDLKIAGKNAKVKIDWERLKSMDVRRSEVKTRRKPASLSTNQCILGTPRYQSSLISSDTNFNVSFQCGLDSIGEWPSLPALVRNKNEYIPNDATNVLSLVNMFQKKYSDNNQVGQKSDKNIRRRNAKFARLDHLKRCLFIEQAEEQKEEDHHVNSVRHRRGSLGNQENMNGSSGAFNDPNNENTKTSFASEDLEAAIIDGSLFLHNDKIDVQIDENNDQNQKGTGNRDDDDVEYENERDPDNDSLNDTGKDGSGKSDSSGSETEVEESDSVGLGSWNDFNNFPGNDGGDDADDYSGLVTF